MEFGFPVLLFALLLASATAGWAAQGRLSAHHVSRESVESIRLIMGMLLTFSALVLGLLTSSAKLKFDERNNDLSIFAVDLIELDHGLRLYGADADPIRASLRRYTAAAIADTWPDEVLPAGGYPRYARPGGPGAVEGTELGRLLGAVDAQVHALAPADDPRRALAERLRSRVGHATEHRWQLIFSGRSTVSWPFLVVLACWLSIIFTIFGLTAPRNRLVYAVLGLSALSIVSPLYLIIDYSDALTGLLQLSSTPLRAALAHMDAPD